MVIASDKIFVESDIKAIASDIMAIASDIERSPETIGCSDPETLAILAERERTNLLSRDHLRPFEERVLCVALCQGAALHYVNGTNGVKDFDVYTFFAELPGRSGPFNRSPRQRDYGPSKFGRDPGDPDHFTGRRVDLFWRTLDADQNADPAEAVRGYLRNGVKCSTPWHLAQEAVVLLRPKSRIGEVVWPDRGRAALAEG